MNLLNLFLLALITASTFAAFHLSPIWSKRAPVVVNALGVFLIAFSLNLTFPAWLEVLLRNGELTWAQPFSGTRSISVALAYAFLGLVTFCVGYFGVGRRAVPQSRQTPPTQVPPVAVAFLWAVLGLGLLLKLAALMTIGLGPSLFVRLSGSARRIMIQVGTEDTTTAYLVMISGIADAAAAMLFVVSLRNGRRLAPAILLLVITMSLTFILSGKRSTLLLVAALIVVALSSLRRPITTRAVPAGLVSILALGMGTLLLRALVPQQLLGNAVNLNLISYSRGSLLDFYLFSPEFAGFDMLVRATAQAQTIVDSLGGRLTAVYRANFEPFAYIIPRALWPDKPDSFVDISHGFFVAVSGGGITAQTPGFAATLIGDAAVLGGPWAVAGAMLAFGAAAALIDRIRGASFSIIYTRAIWLVLMFQMFRQGSVGWVFLGFVQTMIPTILVWVGFSIILQMHLRPTARYAR